MATYSAADSGSATSLTPSAPSGSGGQYLILAMTRNANRTFSVTDTTNITIQQQGNVAGESHMVAYATDASAVTSLQVSQSGSAIGMSVFVIRSSDWVDLGTTSDWHIDQQSVGGTGDPVDATHSLAAVNYDIVSMYGLAGNNHSSQSITFDSVLTEQHDNAPNNFWWSALGSAEDVSDSSPTDLGTITFNDTSRGATVTSIIVERDAGGGTDATATPAAISTTTTVSATASGTTVVNATATPASITTTTTVSASASGDTVVDGTASPAAIATTTTVAAAASGTTVVDATASPAAITTTTTVDATAVGGANGDATASPAAITTTTTVSGAASGTSVIDATAAPAAIVTTVTVTATASSAEATYYYTPPTRGGAAVPKAENLHQRKTSRSGLFRRLVPVPIGQAVLFDGSSYTLHDAPTSKQVNAAQAAYLGGRRHLVTYAQRQAIEASGVGGSFEDV